MEDNELTNAEARQVIRELKEIRKTLTDPEEIKEINLHIHAFEEHIHSQKPDRLQEGIDREMELLWAKDD